MSNVSTETMDGIGEQADDVLDHVEGENDNETVLDLIDTAPSIYEALFVLLHEYPERKFSTNELDYIAQRMQEKSSIPQPAINPKPAGDISINASVTQFQIPGESKKPIKLVLELSNSDNAMNFIAKVDRDRGVRVYGMLHDPDAGQMEFDGVEQSAEPDEPDDDSDEETESQDETPQEAAQGEQESPENVDDDGSSYPADAVRHEKFHAVHGPATCSNCDLQVGVGYAYTHYYNDADEVVGCRHE